MHNVKIEVPMTKEEYNFLVELAEKDQLTPKQELVALCRLQLQEEIELDEAIREGRQ